MQTEQFLKWMLIVLLAGSVCPALHGQSVAEAARQQKEKKQKKQADAAKDAGKPKVYTNEDIPESKSGSSQNAQGQSAGTAAGSTPASAKTEPANTGAPNAKNAGEVEFKLSSPRFKRPGGSEIDWFAKNTSDHAEQLTLKTVITGPCKYRQENSGSFQLTSGEGLTDNQLSLVVYESNCAGTYNVELRLISGGEVLSTASASATVE